MARIVQKFGGTSVGDIERIHHVATLVKREVESGNEVAVVPRNAFLLWCGPSNR